jgi:biotin carboxylase
MGRARTARGEGVATNRELLARIVADPRFVAGEVSTTWLAEAACVSADARSS